MSENKINEIIGEIIHMACQAELIDDEQIKRQALGDIADALASVLPVDNRAARSGVRALPSDGRACAPSPADSEMQRLEARKARKIHWQTFSTKVDLTAMGRTRQNGKVYEIRIQKRKDPKATSDFFCSVNGLAVLDGTFTCSAWTAERILENAMQALVNTKARRRRMKRFADKRRVGILSPEQELAETVRRQKEG